ncbi:hypothetical protein RZS28_10485 [Methylocapsa polymorpha]|uniref:ATP synthase subunit b n=1 Tax=Methylocapsa polymorpha TaxID=3080828 RepID=A0ABZ0HLW0_9HYPH|nr:hypothetical protein RZS28_10485 [Methylocapsa sp. RX1]
MNDVKARLETIAQSQAKRLAKTLSDLGETTAKLTAIGTAAAEQGRRLVESEVAKLKRQKLSPFAWSLVAAGSAGAIVSLAVALGAHSLDGEGARIARLDQSIAALGKRVDSIERTDNEALATSRITSTALANRVAAAESAISKSTTLTNSTLAEIQKTVSSQQPHVLSSGETVAQFPDLGRLEQRLAALEEKVKAQGASVGETSAELPADVGHGAGAFPPFESANFTPLLIWLVLSFGLLYLLMSKIALPRVENILQTRAAKLAKDLSEASAFHKRSEEAAAAHDKTIADARAKAQALAQETHVKLNAEADAKRHALESDLNAKLSAAETQIAETKAKAMANVEGIAGEAATAIVEHITGKPADPKAIAAALTATKA